MADVFGVIYQIQHRGPDDYACQEVADHCAQAQTFGQRYRRNSGQQEDNGDEKEAALFVHEGFQDTNGSQTGVSEATA